MNAPPEVVPEGLDAEVQPRPWPALWALIFGFFMILVDSTIVSVATDAILVGLRTDVNGVVWVTSAYLMAYVVPLLLTGRLGDRFGPKRVYMVGMVVFTLASVWCGFSPTIGSLILARVVQGLGAAMMSPQTMAVVTRIFPRASRGTAMSVWGSAAGVAMLVGPIAGGFLVSGLGWEWIFFVNAPIGIVGLILAWRLVPDLPTHHHRFDLLGNVLNAAGIFLIVFGLEQGEQFNWGTIAGPVTVPELIVAGVAVMVAFVWWQRVNPKEPLLSLGLFRDRNFSLANLAVAGMAFGTTGMAIPLMLYAQKALGLSTVESALLMVPLAFLSISLARLSGRLTDRVSPRVLAPLGLAVNASGMACLGLAVRNGATPPLLIAALALMGMGSPFVWAPLSATANRTLPLRQAGAGAGVYNTTRQIGAVLGSAAIGVTMQSRIQHYLPQLASGVGQTTQTGALPPSLVGGFGSAMGDTLLLAACGPVFGALVAVWFVRPGARTVPDAAATGSSDS